jgi:hypothetical protein
MKSLKLFLCIGFLIFPFRSFSQSFQPSDLIGVWQYGPDITTAKITFLKDSTLIMDDQDEKNKLVAYTFEKTDSGFLLRMQPKDSDSTDVMYFKIKKLDQNQINLEIFKAKVFNKTTNDWDEHAVPPGTIMVLRRKK